MYRKKQKRIDTLTSENAYPIWFITMISSFYELIILKVRCRPSWQVKPQTPISAIFYTSNSAFTNIHTTKGPVNSHYGNYDCDQLHYEICNVNPEVPFFGVIEFHFRFMQIAPNMLMIWKKKKNGRLLDDNELKQLHKCLRI